jgi:hypothetical protein
VLYKDYDRNVPIEKKYIYISGRESQADWCQDELIGDKPPI